MILAVIKCKLGIRIYVRVYGTMYTLLNVQSLADINIHKDENKKIVECK